MIRAKGKSSILDNGKAELQFHLLYSLSFLLWLGIVSLSMYGMSI